MFINYIRTLMVHVWRYLGLMARRCFPVEGVAKIGSSSLPGIDYFCGLRHIFDSGLWP